MSLIQVLTVAQKFQNQRKRIERKSWKETIAEDSIVVQFDDEKETDGEENKSNENTAKGDSTKMMMG